MSSLLVKGTFVGRGKIKKIRRKSREGRRRHFGEVEGERTAPRSFISTKHNINIHYSYALVPSDFNKTPKTFKSRWRWRIYYRLIRIRAGINLVYSSDIYYYAEPGGLQTSPQPPRTERPDVKPANPARFIILSVTFTNGRIKMNHATPAN